MSYFLHPKRTSALTVAIALSCSATSASAQATYAQLHPILAAAITRGATEGFLTGPVHDNLTKQFKSDGPLLVKAQRLEALKQKDCFKLSITFVKQKVPSAKGPTDAVIHSTMNYCLDGGAPTL